ncbi:MAG TPA: hypothetical protein VFG69_07795 [Nannocystaceae bacterium]|nr:hypothetical protein [Nannocystaceae bacterium]
MRRALLAMMLALAGCTARDAELPGAPGHVTGSCLDDACFAGAVCLSELCVDPSAGEIDDDDDDGSGSATVGMDGGDDGPSRGCTCRSGAGGPAIAGWGLALLALVRRRRAA